MRYAEIKLNDVANAPGVAVSFYTQGCPHHCPGCFNSSTWDFEGGKEFTAETLDTIIKGLTANGIKRSLCILGGEPLCEDNAFLTDLVIEAVHKKLPDTKIYVWTGYLYEEVQKSPNSHIQNILNNIDCLIDGPFIEAEKDLSLTMRGSRNQRVIYFDKETKI
jgi:anaerobic ribonucleoside-triphosphate reductase activating protein